MKTIGLSNGMVAIVDDEDYERLLAYTWWAEIDTRTDVVYARGKRRIGNTGSKRGVVRDNPKVRMHQVVMQAHDPSHEIDHVDHNGLNNQKFNLRLATRKEQTHNTRGRFRARRSLFKGVEKAGAKWRARIRINGKSLHLGCFESQHDAALAYNKAATQHFGQFAYLNSVE